MTSILRVCDRYTMTYTPTPLDKEQTWFADWALRSPKETGLHLNALYNALKDIQYVYQKDKNEIRSVKEYFGGIGAQALMIQDLFHPEHHWVGDYSAAAAFHMRLALPARVSVEQADAYDPSSCIPADLVALDFGDMTVWKTREGEPHRQLMDRVFAHRPRAVTITDIAARYLHLHRDRYETLLPGCCGSYEDYLEGLADRIQLAYGYRLLSGYTRRWSTVMSFVPLNRRLPEGRQQWGTFRETPATPVGLEIL